MNARNLFIAVTVCLALPLTGLCGGFDEARVITGNVDRLIEINSHRILENVDPDTVGLPRAFVIDLHNRTMRGTADSLVRRVVPIERIDHLPGKLILQGTDEGTAGTTGGLGWSLTIEKATGQAVLSATGSGIAYVAFGTCDPSPTTGE